MPNRHDPPEFPDLLKAIAGAVGSVAAFETASRTLLSSSGWAQVLIPIVSATGMLAICVHIFLARQRAAPLTVPRSRPHRGKLEHKYGAMLRVFCGTAALMLLALLIYRCWQILPNTVTGRSHLAGVLCSSGDGAPIVRASLEVVDRAGQTASTRATETDDRGFFYVGLRRWRLPPKALRIVIPACGGSTDVPLSAAAQGACPAARDMPTVDVSILEWRLSCGSH
jgi:hypothetical protein